MMSTACIPLKQITECCMKQILSEPNESIPARDAPRTRHAIVDKFQVKNDPADFDVDKNQHTYADSHNFGKQHLQLKPITKQYESTIHHRMKMTSTENFMGQQASPAFFPSEIDIQHTLDTLEKETEKTFIYNNSNVFRHKVEKTMKRSDSSSSSESEASNNSSMSFLNNETEVALDNLRDWVRRNDPLLHKALLISEEFGTIPLILDLCNQLCDKATKKSARERSPKLGSHILTLENEVPTDEANALDLVVKILMDATHEGNVQQTAHAVALQFLASPDPDENARGTQSFLPDNYGPKVLTKVLRQHIQNPHLQKHGWATFGNVLNNAPSSVTINPLESLDDDPDLIKSLLDAALISLQFHQRNHDVVHILLNTMGTMIHKLSLFRKAFLENKYMALDILKNIYNQYASNLNNGNGAGESAALHDFLSVASRSMRLVFYLTRASKSGVLDGNGNPELSQDFLEMIVEMVIHVVNELPPDDTEDGTIDTQSGEAHTFLCWLQIQVIQKMACAFFETCLYHGLNAEFLIEAGALTALSKIAEGSSQKNPNRNPEAIADEATKARAKQVIKELVG
ncbi:hypothetical protein IV203_015310 [Nitzschia inconspicua]|uniref:Uncharacterized protein n=1 Tax=Nitzschia inconspicua TaxID=303405 RepID=A0A9K3PTD4_9STRA|nr:hypothetical protein IV203_015310 [Nitzschia inconspicua]